MSDHHTIWDKQVLVNELQVQTDKMGKSYIFVELVDTDDEIKFILGDQEIVALRNYLNEVIRECKLDPSFDIAFKEMRTKLEDRIESIYGVEQGENKDGDA